MNANGLSETRALTCPPGHVPGTPEAESDDASFHELCRHERRGASWLNGASTSPTPAARWERWRFEAWRALGALSSARICALPLSSHHFPSFAAFVAPTAAAFFGGTSRSTEQHCGSGASGRRDGKG